MDRDPVVSPSAPGSARRAAGGVGDIDGEPESATIAPRRAEEVAQRRLARLQEGHEATLEVVERQRQQIATLKDQLAAIKGKVAAIRARLPVRVLLRLLRLAEGLAHRGRRARAAVTDAREALLGPATGRHALRASRKAEADITRAIVAALPPAPSPPALSITAIVAPTADRATGRVEASLAASGMRPRIVVLGPEESLAAAATAATTDAVLLVSAEVEPLESGWLGRLAAALEETGAAAVGSRLVWARRSGSRFGSRSEAADLTVRDEGIGFALRAARPVPIPAGGGRSPLDRPFIGRWPVAALDSCLLVRTDALAQAGGLHPDQRLDEMDPDLSLRLRAAGGEVLCVGDAVAWHHGPASAPSPGLGQRLEAAWGPALVRAILADRLRGGGTWSERAATFAIRAPVGDDGPAPMVGPGAGGVSSDVARSLEAGGWTAVPAAGAPGGSVDVDVAVILDPTEEVASLPRRAIRVACISGSADDWLTRPWLDDVDVVLVDSEAAAAEIARHSTRCPVVVGPRSGHKPGDVEFPASPGWGPAIVQAARDWVAAQRFAVVMGADTWEKAPLWGDSYFTRALQRQLERRGHPTVVAVTNDAGDPYVTRADAVVHVFGVRAPATRPGQVNILWLISHSDRVTRRLCDGYDILFSASDVFGADLAERLGRPVHPLHQATDEERFRPDPAGPPHEVLFVGNSRMVRRATLDHLAGTSVDLSVYGRNWTPELLDPRYLKGSWVPNDKLGSFYSGAAIVLADHWPDMRDEGFIANRVYDAAAAGAFVVSDDVVGIDEEFDGGVATFSDRDDLVAIIERYLADPEARREASERARRAVLTRHTFGHRADALLAEVRPLLAARASLAGPAEPVRHGG